MKWELSDGTVVHLGGRVDGDSPAAVYLRARLSVPGERMRHPIPSGTELIDSCNPYHVNAEVDTVVRCLGVGLVSRSELPMLERDDTLGDETYVPGRIY